MRRTIWKAAVLSYSERAVDRAAGVPQSELEHVCDVARADAAPQLSGGPAVHLLGERLDHLLHLRLLVVRVAGVHDERRILEDLRPFYHRGIGVLAMPRSESGGAGGAAGYSDGWEARLVGLWDGGAHDSAVQDGGQERVCSLGARRRGHISGVLTWVTRGVARTSEIPNTAGFPIQCTLISLAGERTRQFAEGVRCKKYMYP